jgi:hypothetical protein
MVGITPQNAAATPTVHAVPAVYAVAAAQSLCRDLREVGLGESVPVAPPAPPTTSSPQRPTRTPPNGAEVWIDRSTVALGRGAR